MLDRFFDWPPMSAHPDIEHPPGMTDDFPVLLGDRVRLRGYRPEDLHDFYAVHSDPRVMRYWSFPAWTEISQSYEYFASAIQGRDPNARLCWAITDRDNDRVMGGTTLFSNNLSQGRAEIGYVLGHAHWGQGYAQEALRLVIDYTFDVMGFRRIEADIDPRNAGSCTLAERLGFVREGLLRERWIVADEVQDAAIYGLLARDWRARRADALRQ